MSTQIKNTLFRFVTMRAPELISDETVSTTFIKHYQELGVTTGFNSEFIFPDEDIPEGETRAKVLAEVAQVFGNTSALTTVSELYTGATPIITRPLYDFSVWLTNNRSRLTVAKAVERINLIPIEGILSQPRFILWENLFYQIITNKSPNIREAILSILVGDYFLTYFQDFSSDAEYIKLAQSKVVIPKLLLPEPTVRETINSVATAKKTMQQLKSHLLEEQIAENKKIIEKLNKVKIKFNRETTKQYKTEQEQYNLDVKDALANAETIERIIIDPVTEAERTIIQYVNPVLPEFNFATPNELTLSSLEYALTAQEVEIVNQIIATEELDTFDELISHLEAQIIENTGSIFQNAQLDQQIVNVGGALIPVTTGIDQTKTFSIGAKAKSLSQNVPLTLLFANNLNNVDVVAADYTVEFEDESFLEKTTFTDMQSNEGLVLKLAPEGLSIQPHNSFRVWGTFTLADGKEIYFDGNAEITEETYSFDASRVIVPIEGNSYSHYTVSGKGIYKDSPVGEGGQEIEEPLENTIIRYIPKDYGVKRLGIADYRKVEQEICCYVPGEVSHIENIMASEYKDRTTRSLYRSEDTTSLSSEKESEKLTDTTTSSRFEMNQEVSSLIANDVQFGAQYNAHWKGNKIESDLGTNFATNHTKEQSNNQATTQAKEITERALDRIVQKVREERISKITNEFEETNTHGFDNRKNPNHISGVYRWVDKVYRNQVVNYGKRLMYEFMIPEPAAFHNLAFNGKKNNISGDVLTKPTDPRTADKSIALNLDKDFDSRYMHWVNYYNVEITEKMADKISVGKSFNILGYPAGAKMDHTESNSGNGLVNIPEDYQSYETDSVFNATSDNDYQGNLLSLTVGNKYATHSGRFTNYSLVLKQPIDAFTNEVPVSYTLGNHVSGDITVSVKCQWTEKAKKQWQLDTFNAIIKAYEAKLEEYNEKMMQVKTIEDSTKSVANSYTMRQIENTVLRKNCIEYLVSHENMVNVNLLKGTKIGDLQVDYNNPKLDDHAARVKFFEQAFEWDLMSYNFYPFYWANSAKWESLYNVTEANDQLFRAFLQSGMARVVVTVRPGFEEAVNWYMATGQIWEGGLVPVINDPLFLSIVEELRETEGVVEETWETRLPTSLTLLQAGTIGLNVQGLPCDEDCADYKLFDSEGQPVLDENGDPISTNPIVQTDSLSTINGQEEGEDTPVLPGDGSDEEPEETEM